jgi:hypothetical protein
MWSEENHKGWQSSCVRQDVRFLIYVALWDRGGKTFAIQGVVILANFGSLGDLAESAGNAGGTPERR